MEIDPPIPARTDKQLFEIIENPESWRDDVVDLAKGELMRRGVPVEVQTHRRITRKKYYQKVIEKKAQASYGLVEKIWIMLIGPFKGLTYLYGEEGYTTRNRQGRLYLLLGYALWALVIYISLQFELW